MLTYLKGTNIKQITTCWSFLEII